MWFCILLGKKLEGAFENTEWKINRIRPLWLCIVWWLENIKLLFWITHQTTHHSCKKTTWFGLHKLQKMEIWFSHQVWFELQAMDHRPPLATVLWRPKRRFWYLLLHLKILKVCCWSVVKTRSASPQLWFSIVARKFTTWNHFLFHLSSCEVIPQNIEGGDLLNNPLNSTPKYWKSSVKHF